MSARSLLRTLAAALACSFGGLTGCFQMEYGLTLESDLSGVARLEMTIDVDRLAWAIASAQRSFGGEEGPPTAEEVAEARRQIEGQMEQGALEETNLRAEIEPDLPEGIELVEATDARDGLQTSVKIVLGFDHVSRLNQMNLSPEGPADQSEPFSGLELVDEGDTFVIRNDALNPVRDAEASAGSMGDFEELIAEMFRDFAITFTLEAPFEVVEHNATERDGNRLAWVWDYEAMRSGGPDPIFVRYRRD